MKIVNMTNAGPNLYSISGSIPWEFMKGSPALTYWLHALNEDDEVSASEKFMVSVNTGYSIRGFLEFDVITVKAEGSRVKPIAYFTNSLPRAVSGAISLVVDGEIVHTSHPTVFESGQTAVELEWTIPKMGEVNGYQLKSIGEFCGTVFETDEVSLNTFPSTIQEPLSEEIEIELFSHVK